MCAPLFYWLSPKTKKKPKMENSNLKCKQIHGRWYNSTRTHTHRKTMKS